MPSVRCELHVPSTCNVHVCMYQERISRSHGVGGGTYLCALACIYMYASLLLTWNVYIPLVIAEIARDHWAFNYLWHFV